MENEISKQILDELRKLRKLSQWTSAAAMIFITATSAILLWTLETYPNKKQDSWSGMYAALNRYDYQAALKYMQDLVVKHPEEYTAYKNMGYIYFKMGDMTHAEAEYARAYEIYPSEEIQKELEIVHKRKAAAAAQAK